MTVNSETLPSKAKPRGKYPHIKRAGDFLYISGTSSRQADGTFRGGSVDAAGTRDLDVAEQTRGVLENIKDYLTTQNADLTDIVDLTCYLANMNDFKGYNEAYADYFGDDAPARTTVAVDQLPHPLILVEIKGTAYKPI